MGNGKTKSKTMNRGLGVARAAKQDEFYTQYVDIQKEVESYLEFDPDTFRGNVVYCNCDDPFESNFFKYFAANFNKLGLKKLITTSYDGSPIAGQLALFPEQTDGNGHRPRPKAVGVIVDQVKDENNDGATDIEDVKLFLKRNKAARIALKPDENYTGGDFRSADCVELLKQADIVVTNPPFSLFRQYVAQLVTHGKKFLIIGNINAITYKEVFPLIKANKIWLGNGMGRWISGFIVPKTYELYGTEARIDESGNRIVATNSCLWLTNIDHGRRHQPLPLMTMTDNLKHSRHKEIKGKKAYDKYDNYDAIDVPFTDAIPSDFDGAMGVPITFLDKYNPDQFEILGITKTWDGGASKTYPIQTQISKDGSESLVSKLNDGAAVKVSERPTAQTYYRVGSENFIQVYARVLIRHRNRSAKGKKK